MAVRASGGELVIEYPPDRRRANDSVGRRELLWVAVLLKEAEKRGESPRAFVDKHTHYSAATLTRRIRDARLYLEQDWRFQDQVDTYQFVERDER